MKSLVVEPLAWIVTPTLSKKVGENTIREAAKTAGIPVLGHVAVDEEEEGGTKTANRALRATEEYSTPYVCYINDDVAFPQEDWLKLMIEALETDAKFGIAGPSGKCPTAQGKGRQGMPHGIKRMRWELSFFCAVFKREVLERVGYLDERFIHYGCDNDYCIRAKKAGWGVVWVQHVFVRHARSRLKQRWKKRDVAAFRAKWPEGERMRG